MKLGVDPTSPVPVSEQIAEGIRFAVASGECAPGERLPSVRGLAREILVNPNTVAKVYRDLEREGVVRTRPGLGVFVAEGSAARCRRASRDVVLRAMRAAVGKAVGAGLGPAEVESLVADCLFEAGAAVHE